MGEDLLLEQMKAATEEWRKTPPKERFDSLVRSGVIDGEGRLLRHFPQPPEAAERPQSPAVESLPAVPEQEQVSTE